MIIPGSRIIKVSALTLPFFALAALSPGNLLPAFFLLILVVIAALFDLIAVCLIERDMQFALPETVRLAKDRPGVLPININNPSMQQRFITLGVDAPGELASETDEIDLAVLQSQESTSCTWPCAPYERGHYTITDLYVEHTSPLRLWHRRDRHKTSCEVRVYPDILGERRKMSAFFLHRGSVGIHTRRMVGQGREFEKLRDYIPGDSYSDIHWKTTAKRGKPVTKLFQIERTQEIYVLIDSSRASNRKHHGTPVLEQYLTSSLLLALVAEQQGDHFGLITFNDKVRRFIRAAGGKAQFNICRDALTSLKHTLVTPDYDELITFACTRLQRRSLLLILTDLSDPVAAESFLQNIDMLRRKHIVIVCMVKSPQTAPLFSCPVDECNDPVYTALAEHYRYQDLAELQKALQRRNVTLCFAESENLTAEMVSQYMSIKARQLL